ncbi:hypothetical protein [Streptomyces sp. URMC 123]|uniref:hypothetical protein n=1 Tax=Streptomyces sp. URMC 123 TaxID=3423403 RepID=UPI003F1D4E32
MIETRKTSAVVAGPVLALDIKELESLDAPWTWQDAGRVIGNVSQGLGWAKAGVDFVGGVINT